MTFLPRWIWWRVDSPWGPVDFALVPRNDLGVLDHRVVEGRSPGE